MKTVKTLTLDEDVGKRLDVESNKSKLVNDLLRQHFNNTDNPFLSMSDKEIEFHEKIMEILKESDKKINQLEQEYGFTARKDY